MTCVVKLSKLMVTIVFSLSLVAAFREEFGAVKAILLVSEAADLDWVSIYVARNISVAALVAEATITVALWTSWWRTALAVSGVLIISYTAFLLTAISLLGGQVNCGCGTLSLDHDSAASGVVRNLLVLGGIGAGMLAAKRIRCGEGSQ